GNANLPSQQLSWTLTSEDKDDDPENQAYAVGSEKDSAKQDPLRHNALLLQHF
ncbi:hypothetical protein F441_02032, partial [Phytophthora nicotianae CJ01A1]